MEKRLLNQLNFKYIPLLLMLIAPCSRSELFYIRPTYPEDVDCPGTPCQSLKYFDKEVKISKPSITYKLNFDTVTMILIEGCHTIHGRVYNFGSPGNSRILQIIGHGLSNAAIIEELETAITVMDILLESLTALRIYLYIDESVVDSQITNISILNCTFVGSSMILTNVHLTIKDSNFSESTSTAITLFSSTLLLAT